MADAFALEALRAENVKMLRACSGGHDERAPGQLAFRRAHAKRGGVSFDA
jgi:hypothetical protein